jgi:predicted XRE-type DNA-binding protein
MKAEKRKKLEAAGWKVGSTKEFLELTDSETQFLEIKVSLVKMLRLFRKQRHLTQAQLAKRIHSSQSRVAKMEAGDPSVSVDLLMRSLLAAGANPRELGRAVSRS